jgi:hypothetical protein
VAPFALTTATTLGPLFQMDLQKVVLAMVSETPDSGWRLQSLAKGEPLRVSQETTVLQILATCHLVAEANKTLHPSYHWQLPITRAWHKSWAPCWHQPAACAQSL